MTIKTGELRRMFMLQLGRLLVEVYRDEGRPVGHYFYAKPHVVVYRSFDSLGDIGLKIKVGKGIVRHLYLTDEIRPVARLLSQIERKLRNIEIDSLFEVDSSD